MTRADKVRALVADRMQDFDRLYEVFEHSAWKARNEGFRDHVLIDIASAIELAGIHGISQTRRESIATRLLFQLESFARNAIIGDAESDIPLEDDED